MRAPFQYAVLRAVPRVDRGEFINVGIILYCQQHEFLRAAVAVDDVRLRALTAEVDLEAVRSAAEAVVTASLEPVGHARENEGLAHRVGVVTVPHRRRVQS